MGTAAIIGIHHVKFPVSDLQRSREWYERVLGVQVLVDFPDADGVVRGLAGLLPGVQPPFGVALRENPDAAIGNKGFDPVSFAIADREAADAWAERLDALGIEHTPVRQGSLGWVLDMTDPDGTVIRLYSAQQRNIDHDGEPGYARLITDDTAATHHSAV
jgi:catechol 2,3-dioxygenase-like lactoylglutathione lyase family enzyme